MTGMIIKKDKRTSSLNGKQWQAGETFSGWMFLLPSFVLFILFRFVPIIFTVILSFADWNLISGIKGINFVGFDNFQRLLQDQTVWDSLGHTFEYTLGVVPLAIILSLLVAVVLNGKVYCKSAIRLMFYMPYVCSMVAVAIIWAILYQPSYGPINMILKQFFGVKKPPLWISSTKWSMISLIIMGVWQVIGYNMVIFLAGLQGIPRTYYEAADIAGANGFQKFIFITIPLLSPTIFFITITSVINSFQVFGPVNILTQGGPGTSTNVLVYHVYNLAFKYYDIGYANCVSVLLFIIVFLMTVVQWKLQDRWVYE